MTPGPRLHIRGPCGSSPSCAAPSTRSPWSTGATRCPRGRHTLRGMPQPEGSPRWPHLHICCSRGRGLGRHHNMPQV